MGSKTASKNLLYTCLVCFNCGHGTCNRSVSGKVEFMENKTEVKISIRKHTLTYSKWRDPVVTEYDNAKGVYYLTTEQYDPQNDCYNNCPDGKQTMPDSFRVTIYKGNDNQVLKDTFFSCDDYIFNGDDIELPTITLP